MPGSTCRFETTCPKTHVQIWLKCGGLFQDVWAFFTGCAVIVLHQSLTGYVSQIIKSGVWYCRTLIALFLKVPESPLEVEVLNVVIFNSYVVEPSNIAYGRDVYCYLKTWHWSQCCVFVFMVYLASLVLYHCIMHLIQLFEYKLWGSPGSGPFYVTPILIYRFQCFLCSYFLNAVL